MERDKIKVAKNLFGKNFIGIDELQPFLKIINSENEYLKVPDIDFDYNLLEKCSEDYILILGIDSISSELKLNIMSLINLFPHSKMSNPKFYNQDWYLKQDFILKCLELKWYLVKKNPFDKFRKKTPDEICKVDNKINFPSAILCIYTFFAYYFHVNEILWENDYIWCSDFDNNGDRIYIGRYNDSTGLNISGLSIHRHLSIANNYTAINAY